MLATYHVASLNPYADFSRPAESFGSVSYETEAELSRFKKNDPHGFNRMLITGGEATLQSNNLLQENNFFRNANLPVELIMFLNIGHHDGYAGSKLSDIDKLTNDVYASGDSVISERDFTGHDFSAWVWHLF
jgi:hypothetical protein